MAVETERIRKLNAAPERPHRKYVLYWAQMNRRVDANHGLLYAAEIANQHRLPVLYYEGLTCSYPYANDRLHTFILEGVPETAKRLKKAGIGYVFYLRRRVDSPNNIFYQLARDAAAVVTDDYPVFIARRHNSRVPEKLDVAFYVVDSSCVVPMSQIPTRQFAAYTIRPKITKLLPKYLQAPDQLRVKRRFEEAVPSFHVEVHDGNIAELVRSCEIDHSIQSSPSFTGGRLAAEKLLRFFLENNLKRFDRDRNQPAEHATSHMSPYLHFGQISSLEIALAVKDYAAERHLMADSYLEELIVRRELSFNYVRHVERPERLENLPEWARETMRKHANDQRNPLYTPQQLERAETYDDLWNATQKEMMLRGKIHGYYRIYWGKKVLEWSPTYQSAVDWMINTHGRYALDGRDPNTYVNILWCFGLHDRAWGERPIFGKIRYMSGDSIRRKTNAKAYIKEIQEMEKTGNDPTKVI
ncbi:MAG: deoxyribodipyrimidine photo-lyase [Acidobacteriaceae bacterium]|nr:deoxyribodipyrimidine photo-lyase [Acidobacteriaceae bacterium]